MIDVGSVDDFNERAVRVVAVEGREIGIVRWRGDEIYAIHNRCPHMAGPVCRGGVGPKLVCRDGSPGSLFVDEDTPVLACAWHRWEFDVRSGEALWDPGYRVKTYPVDVVDGRVFVALTKGGSRSGGR